jgi:hypothetical protein
MSWSELLHTAPELGAFGKVRLTSGVAYLATRKANGAPRVHPVTPIVGDRVFVFMEPTSPKGHDLRRDGRYAIHCAVEDTNGGAGEFLIEGRAQLVEDAGTRALAEQYANYQPKERYILFELHVDAAASTVYADDGPVRRRWSRPS